MGECVHGGRLSTEDDSPIVAYGDGSGGAYSTDWRYRRCGWAWARLKLTDERSEDYELAAAKHGPLPGGRQTSNRAELWAFLSCLESTYGKLVYWTDSEVLAKGWRAQRFRKAATAGSNGDIWEKIGEEIHSRGGAEGWTEIDICHMNSHLSAQEAQAKGVPRHAWEGNRIVDKLAEEAATRHAIPDTEMACYVWARATAQVVRARIAVATMHSIEDNPKEEREVKEKRKAERQSGEAAGVRPSKKKRMGQLRLIDPW